MFAVEVMPVVLEFVYRFPFNIRTVIFDGTLPIILRFGSNAENDLSYALNPSYHNKT
jgi:hypothetical protein